jgi:hypothetical protein
MDGMESAPRRRVAPAIWPACIPLSYNSLQPFVSHCWQLWKRELEHWPAPCKQTLTESMRAGEGGFFAG